MKQKWWIIFSGSLLLLFGFIFASALWKKSPVYKNSQGLAIQGYDSVAYFIKKQALRGKKEHQMVWKGAIWLFQNEETKSLFRAKMLKYSPKYGGYCAYGISQNYLAGSNPMIWRMFKKKLYLFSSLDMLKLWESDIRGNIRKADKNWLKLIK